MSCLQVEIIENMFQIVDLKQNLVPYKLYDHQKEGLEEYAAAPRGSGFLRHKAASLGSSSGILAFCAAEALTKEHQNIVILAHEEGLAKKLLRRAKQFYKKAMERKLFDVTVLREPQDCIEFSNGSLITIATAGSTAEIGRGDPFSHLICSEIAFYRAAGSLMIALLPRARLALKIFESTGNGAQGWFFKQCQKAWNGLSKYFFQFTGWQDHSLFTNDRKGRKPVVLTDKGEYELEIAEDFNLSDGQLAWRRDMVSVLDDDENLGLRGEDAFKQEYPLTSVEGFLRTGSQVFGHRVYEMVQKTLLEPNFVGDIG